MPIDSLGLGAAMILITNVILAFLKPFLADIPALKQNNDQLNSAIRMLNVVINLGLICSYVAFTGQFNPQDLPSYGIQAALQAAGANTVFLFVKGSGSGKTISTDTPLAKDIESAASALGQTLAKQPLQADPAAKSNIVSSATEQPTIQTAAVGQDASWLG
jgi:hypothetical protein